MTQSKTKEWSNSRRWNPFNSYKVLAHVNRWGHIKRGRPMPSPVLITVDPTNICNFDCIWCNAEYIREQRKGYLSQKALEDIANFLPKWGEDCREIEPGVKAVCIAGGGEPFLNPNTAGFIDRLRHNNIEVGVVTNGSRIEASIDALSQCTWVGVSVDAATEETFVKLKGTSPEKKVFGSVIDSISSLVDYSKRHNALLGYKHPAYGVSYKYLLHTDNIGEMFQAAKLAKEIGCKNIHFRPASTSWDKIGTEHEISFSKDDVEKFQEQIELSLELTDENFGVYGVTHKFNDQFERCNNFNVCYAIFMTAVIMPPTEEGSKDSFIMGLCCDRRGDPSLELLTNCDDVNQIKRLWGSKEHWRIHDKINVERDCPRCTYQPHNEVYEQVILNDSMTYKFI